MDTGASKLQQGMSVRRVCGHYNAIAKLRLHFQKSMAVCWLTMVIAALYL
jgi:hypothetical protein